MEASKRSSSDTAKNMKHWDSSSDSDTSFLAQLKAFGKKHGHLNVTGGTEHKRLLNWIAAKRKEKKRGSIDPQIANELENIGFEWEVARTRTSATYEEISIPQNNSDSENYVPQEEDNEVSQHSISNSAKFEQLYKDPYLQRKFYERLQDIEERNAKGMRPQTTPWRGEWTKDEKALFRSWIMKFRHRSYKASADELLRSLMVRKLLLVF
jgi:hypothetical protein